MKLLRLTGVLLCKRQAALAPGRYKIKRCTMRISYLIAAMGLITVLTMDALQIQCWRPPAHKRKSPAAATAPAIPAAHLDDAKSLNRRAISLHSQGKYSEALADYQRALKLDSKNPAYHNNIALLFKDMDLLALAENESQRAIKLNPK